MSRPLVADPRTALWLGVGFSLAGTFFLWDAYGRRGRKQPLALRAIGLVG